MEPEDQENEIVVEGSIPDYHGHNFGLKSSDFKESRRNNAGLCAFASVHLSMSLCTVGSWLLFLCLLGSILPQISFALKVVGSPRADDRGMQPVARRNLSFSSLRRYHLRRELEPFNISVGLSWDESILLSWRNSSNDLKALWIENQDSGPCDWRGVTCGYWRGETRVTGVNVASLNFTGAIPKRISTLAALNSLSFASNKLSGSIPPDIGSCVNLKELNLTDNLLTGHIPVELGRLVQLQSLDISRNRLNGTVPPELFKNCSNLVTFNISSNNLTGALPTGLVDCASLRIVDVGNNTLQGQIPSSWERLSNLEELIMADNLELNGTIPLSLLSNCQSLRKLDMAWNRFRGPLPSQLGNCSNLEMLILQGNKFDGLIPRELGNLKKLKVLGLGNNNLSGELPQNISQCSSLELLDVGNNAFTGAIPPWLGQLANLQFVTFQINKFSGTIPVEVTTLTMLRYIDFSNNSLHGSVLPEFSRVDSLRLLRLSFNNLTGNIPEELGYMYRLQGLDLSSNFLNGSIPKSFGNLQDLLWLQLGNNSLTGKIPQELTNCSSLMWLNLGHNYLRGQIPHSFSKLGWDSERVFRQNEQNPWILDGVGECSILATWAPGQSQHFESLFDISDTQKCHVWLPLLVRGGFKLRSDRITGNSKVLSYWQLGKNCLNGAFPDVKNASSLGFLILSENRLKGPIPREIGNLPLYNLNISHNYLNGSIPETLGDASLLITLDMSNNSLSGPLPLSLGKLTALSVFNVSYNSQLRGAIPTEGQLLTFGWDSFIGDYNLCLNDADPLYKQASNNLSQSSANAPKLCSQMYSAVSSEEERRSSKKKKLAVEITVMILTSALSALLLLSSVYCMVTKWRKRMATTKEGMDPYWGDFGSGKSHRSAADSKSSFHSPVESYVNFPCLKSLTYAQLVHCTGNFSPENIVGDGGFGIVYKAKLGDGTTVAIKKLVQNGAQGLREFRAEMDTLGMIQHENLVSLLGYCCNNDDLLLVYEYFVNGSLDDWLYESEEKAARLGWSLRLRIALETARGLAFLHHECVHLIIHRDMKSSNILLNENFKAVLTDFGMARIMDIGSTHVSTIVAGTPGYVPPEYSQTWRATTKGDVYSFGVVMLELVSGKRPTGPHFNGHCGANLIEMARILVTSGRPNEVCDAKLLESSAPHGLSLFLALAMRCTETSPTSRPTMLEVVKTLEFICKIQGSATASQRDVDPLDPLTL